MTVAQRIRRSVGIDRPENKSRACRVRSMHGARLLQTFEYACGYCAEAVDAETYTLDHYIDLHCGGTNRLENLVVCCSRCNGSKAHKDPVAWMRYKGYDLKRLDDLRERWCTIVNIMFGPWEVLDVQQG